jgi:hypothetical protein
LVTLDLPGFATLRFTAEALARPVTPIWKEWLFAVTTDALLYSLAHLQPDHPETSKKSGLLGDVAVGNQANSNAQSSHGLLF